MKKLIYGTLFLALVGIGFVGCKKEQLNKSSLRQNEKSMSQQDLVSLINSQTVSSFEKGQILLGENDLSTNVQKELAEKASLFDPFVLEVVFISQESIPNIALFRLIENNSVTDGTLISILHSVAPLNQATKVKLAQSRSQINTSMFSENPSEHLISLCSLKIFYTNKIHTLKSDLETSMLFKMNSSLNFYNSISEADLLTLQNGLESGGWVRGASTIKDLGDGITQVTCKRPPYTKCMKAVGSTSSSLSSIENDFIDDLNNTVDKFEKANKITNLLSETQALKSRIIDILSDMDGYSQEASLYSLGQFDSNNLIKISMTKSASDAVLLNVLKINAPINTEVLQVIQKIRPKLEVSSLLDFSNKEIAIALCCNEIFIGSQIEISEISNGHKIDIVNLTTSNFVNSVANIDKQKIIAGGGKWIRGEVILSNENTSNNTTTKICSSPPDTKCVKVAKN